MLLLFPPFPLVEALATALDVSMVQQLEHVFFKKHLIA